MTKVLLACGLAYPLANVLATDVIAAAMWDDYSRLDQAISELSSPDAPSQGFLAAMLPLFTALVVGFGVGVWQVARSTRALRWIGVVLVVQGVIFPVWLLFPMSSREVLARGAGGANDTGHLVLTGVALVLILTEMALSAVALGGGFRRFAIAVAIAMLAAGAYVGTTVSAVAAGDPTPWMGLVERVSYDAWLLWMAVLAVVLIRKQADRVPDLE